MAISRSPGSPELFAEWKMLGQRFANQGAIMQNPMELTSEQIMEWVDNNHKLLNSVPDLVIRTYKVIYDNADDELKQDAKGKV